MPAKHPLNFRLFPSLFSLQISFPTLSSFNKPKLVLDLRNSLVWLHCDYCCFSSSFPSIQTRVGCPSSSISLFHICETSVLFQTQAVQPAIYSHFYNFVFGLTCLQNMLIRYI